MVLKRLLYETRPHMLIIAVNAALNASDCPNYDMARGCGRRSRTLAGRARIRSSSFFLTFA